MITWWPLIVSSAGGVVATLLGVIVGALLTSRSQTGQWIRDKQAAACTAVIEESTAMQLALLREQRHGTRADWTAWNQALAGIWLVSLPEITEAAAEVDRVFWRSGARIKAGSVSDGDTWATERQQMERARLNFINVARRMVFRSLAAVTEPPVARPPIAELRQLAEDMPLNEDPR